VYRGTGAARDVNPTDVKSRSGATARPVDEFQIPHEIAAAHEAVERGVTGKVLVIP
jgi:hypothetical protein